MQDLEQVIRERAYLLWMEGGCQDGQAAVHWLAAQREILGASLGEGRARQSRRTVSGGKVPEAEQSKGDS